MSNCTTSFIKLDSFCALVPGSMCLQNRFVAYINVILLILLVFCLSSQLLLINRLNRLLFPAWINSILFDIVTPWTLIKLHIDWLFVQHQETAIVVDAAWHFSLFIPDLFTSGSLLLNYFLHKLLFIFLASRRVVIFKLISRKLSCWNDNWALVFWIIQSDATHWHSFVFHGGKISVIRLSDWSLATSRGLFPQLFSKFSRVDVDEVRIEFWTRSWQHRFVSEALIRYLDSTSKTWLMNLERC